MTPTRLWAGLAVFFIRRKLFRHKIPLLASFKLTYRCNLRCLACPFHQRAGEEPAHMSWETAVIALHRLKQAGVSIIVFEGGEPFLWQDREHTLDDLILLAKKLFLRVAVTTNGTFPLITPADMAWVSVDGIRETHNRLRSQSFDRVWAHLHASRHRRLYVHLTINRENRQDIRPLLDMLAGIEAFRGLTVQFFYPYGQGEAPLALSDREREETIDEIIRLKNEGFPVLNSRNRLKAMIRNKWRCHDDILINVDPDGSITQGCYVKSRGRINCQACGFTPVAEASGALDLIPGSLIAGWSIFIR